MWKVQDTPSASVQVGQTIWFQSNIFVMGGDFRGDFGKYVEAVKEGQLTGMRVTCCTLWGGRGIGCGLVGGGIPFVSTHPLDSLGSFATCTPCLTEASPPRQHSVPTRSCWIHVQCEHNHPHDEG